MRRLTHIKKNGKVKEITSSYKMDEDYYNAIIEELIKIKMKKLIKGGVSIDDMIDAYYNSGEYYRARQLEAVRDQQIKDRLEKKEVPIIITPKKEEKIEKIEKEIEEDKKKVELVEEKIVNIKEEEKKLPPELTTKKIKKRIDTSETSLADINENINNLFNIVNMQISRYIDAINDNDEDEIIRVSRLLDANTKDMKSLKLRRDNLVNEIELENKRLKKNQESQDLLEKLEKEKLQTIEKIKKSKEKKEQEEQKLESRRKLIKELDQKSTLDKKLDSLVTNILPLRDTTKLKKRKNTRK